MACSQEGSDQAEECLEKGNKRTAHNPYRSRNKQGKIQVQKRNRSHQNLEQMQAGSQEALPFGTVAGS